MRTLLIVLLGTVLVGCAAPTPQHAPGTRPGSEAVYERIESLSDCALLQQEFNTASANFDRQEAGTKDSQISLTYMETAQKRIEEVGCP